MAKSLEAETWWFTIKGLVYLPRRLHREVQALAGPLVPREHAAYAACAEFLRYLRDTWYTGMFSGLWDKFGIEELRTTNLAESYHSQLNTLIEGDHPTLTKLILVLRDLDGEAQSALITLEQDPSHTNHIRRKDHERRERVAHKMSNFNTDYQAGVSRMAVDEYCSYMARFVAESAV